jgi:ATP-dependent DNA ligase
MGRSNDWVKKTCAQRETLTIAGFALDGSKWDGLYVARRKGEDLVYAGKVDHGFNRVSAADLKKRLTPLVRKTQAFAKRIAHKGIWVDPARHVEELMQAPADKLVGLDTRPRYQRGVDLRDAPVRPHREIAARRVVEQVFVLVGGQEIRHRPGWLRRLRQARSGSDSVRSP